MDWDKLGQKWQALQDGIGAPARALIVDDEEVVRELLNDILATVWISCEFAGSAEEALAKLRQGTFDVLVTDKNLPGHDGVDLIAQVHGERIDVASVLVTGYPSATTISRALASGACDYIAKPFDDVRHVRKRIQLVVSQHRSEKLLKQIVEDLKSAAGPGTVTSPGDLKRIERELFAFKGSLAQRPDVVLVEPDKRLAQTTSLVLRGGGLSVVTAQGEAEALQLVQRGTLSVLLSLSQPGAPQLLGKLKELDPALELLVTGHATALEEALGAIGAGASDFVLGAAEGLDLFVSRVRRASARSRRQRLFAHLITVLLGTGGRNSTPAQQVLKTLQSHIPASPAPAPVGSHPAPAALSELELPSEDIDVGSFFTDPALESNWGDEVGPMEAPAVATTISDSLYTGIEEQVSYGLDAVDGERMVTLPLRDLLYGTGVMEELIRFFHEPENFSSIEAVRAFVGESDRGALAVLLQAYYEHLRPFLPQDVLRDKDRGCFENPRPPRYLKPSLE